MIKKTAVQLAIAGALLAPAAPAFAFIDGPAVVAAVTSWTQSFMMNQFQNIFGGRLERAFSAIGAGIQGEINKAAVVQKNTAEAIAQYEAQERFRKDALEVNEKLRQPANTCASMATSNNLGKVESKVRAAAAGATRESTSMALSQTNTGAKILTTYDKSLKAYCTEADERFGRCAVRSNPDPKLAGADVNADMLFGNAGDPASRTYAPGQAGAMRDFISRVTSSSNPESLAAVNPRAEKTDAGRAYQDMLRTYAAYLSMSKYSLNSIAASYDIDPGLGERTMMQGRVGKDASMMDVVSAYVAEKFSPKAMKDAATQTQAEVILRDIAQTTSFRLWLEYQNLNQTQRMEAMNAMQLALMTDATLKPMLEAQRRAAMK